MRTRLNHLALKHFECLSGVVYTLTVAVDQPNWLI